MKVRIFRQRVSQVHESEVEINEWLEEMGSSVTIKFSTSINQNQITIFQLLIIINIVKNTYNFI